MIANLPAILKHLKKDGQAEAAGQQSLFGVPSADELKLVDLPEWDEDTRLYFEHKALGLYLTGHPILKVQDKYRKTITHVCRERSDMLRSDTRSRIVVAGLITRFEPRGRIAFLDLEDDTGKLDLMMFSDEMQRLARMLMPNALVALKLRPRHSETRSSLQVIDGHRLGHFRPNYDAMGEAKSEGKKQAKRK